MLYTADGSIYTNKIQLYHDLPRLGGQIGEIGLHSIDTLLGGTVVVAVAPDQVPESRDGREPDEDDTGVVHGLEGDDLVRRHTEQRDGQKTPCCRPVSRLPRRSELRSGRAGRRLTQSNHIADTADDPQVESGVGDLRATTEEERDRDGARVAEGQENHTDTGEGVERGRGAKVDGTEGNLHRHAQHHGVEGNVQRRVDGLPPLGAGDTAVARKRPGAAGGGRHTSHAADDAENEQREKQQEGSGRAAQRIFQDHGGGLPRGQVHQHRDIGQDKGQRQQEAQAGHEVEHDGAHHGFGHLNGRLPDFLAHPIKILMDRSCKRAKRDCSRDDHASRRGGVCGLQQTDTERPAGRPARLGLKVGEDPLTRVSTMFGDHKDGDDQGNQADEGQEDGRNLYGETKRMRSRIGSQDTRVATEGKHWKINKKKEKKRKETYLQTGEPFVA